LSHNFLNPYLLRIFFAKPIILLMHRTENSCLPIKKGEPGNGMRTSHSKPRGATIKRNEWEGILGRLDVLADEINRALGRATRIEEPRGELRIAQIV
jgi:hypothetical protein